MAAQRQVLQFLKQVLPTKPETFSDVSPVDYAQIMVHLNPSLSGRLCFDADAPTSSHRRSLEAILNDVQSQSPSFKESGAKVSADGILKKEVTCCFPLCEALFKLSQRCPFPKTYDARGERAKLVRGSRKRPLEEAASNTAPVGSTSSSASAAKTSIQKATKVNAPSGGPNQSNSAEASPLQQLALPTLATCNLCSSTLNESLSCADEWKDYLLALQVKILVLGECGTDESLIFAVVEDHLKSVRFE
jgi:hypothetical protein